MQSEDKDTLGNKGFFEIENTVIVMFDTCGSFHNQTLLTQQPVSSHNYSRHKHKSLSQFVDTITLHASDNHTSLVR